MNFHHIFSSMLMKNNFDEKVVRYRLGLAEDSSIELSIGVIGDIF